MSYSATAVNAVNLMQIDKKLQVHTAWQKAAKAAFPHSVSSQIKGCPKNTFMALCETGRIRGVVAGNYTRSIHNKRYALAALNILASSPKKIFTPSELWTAVLKHEPDKTKQHNGQMDVVLALKAQGLIET